MNEWKRDQNLASMVKAILELPEEENVTAASVDDKTYRFETTRVYERSCYGESPERVTFSSRLKVWYAIDMIHGENQSQQPNEQETDR